MRTIKNLVFFLLATAMLASCGKVSYRKTKGGMPYQLYKGKSTKPIHPGNIVKANISYSVKDSVYFSSFDRVPQYIPVSAEPQPYDISELWTNLKIGDSLVATQMMDTFIKRNPMGIPPKFQKGDRIITIIKVLDVFANDSAANLDREKTESEWYAKEAVLLDKWVADKKIPVQKTPSGAYVQIIDPGTGNLIDSGNYVSVNYTGSYFSGKKFDSNTDSAFHHVGPYGFVVNARKMITGFDEAMRFMKPGATAKVYVPSKLAYGGNPPQQSGIIPYENLMFDITIVDVKAKVPEETPPQVPVPERKIKVDAPQQHN